VGLFAATCPIRDEERVWTEREMGWLVAQFGAEALAEPVVTPTDDFFPGIYEGAAEDVRRVVAIVGARLGAEPNSYDIDFGDVDPSLIKGRGWFTFGSVQVCAKLKNGSRTEEVACPSSSSTRPRKHFC
jgi:hypothetical protein